MDESLIIYLGLYTVLIFTDLIPAIKRKDKTALWVFIPIFAVTLAANLMGAMGFFLPSINDGIKQILQTTLHMK